MISYEEPDQFGRVFRVLQPPTADCRQSPARGQNYSKNRENNYNCEEKFLDLIEFLYGALNPR